MDLAGLEIRPPEYNYKPQQIAYTRFLPQNTLAAERQFNIQKEQSKKVFSQLYLRV